MPFTAQQARNILIIGSTGVIGTYITRAIVDARENFERICILTSEKTVVEKVQDIAALEAWGVEIFTGRLESERVVKRAYEGMLNSQHSTKRTVYEGDYTILYEEGTGYMRGVSTRARLSNTHGLLQVSGHNEPREWGRKGDMVQAPPDTSHGDEEIARPDEETAICNLH